MFSTALNTLAKAKLVRNAKNKELYKLVIAFNVTQRNARTNKLVFPTQKQCAYVSGDIAYESLQADVARCLDVAKKQLRTTNIVFVD